MVKKEMTPITFNNACKFNAINLERVFSDIRFTYDCFNRTGRDFKCTLECSTSDPHLHSKLDRVFTIQAPDSTFGKTNNDSIDTIMEILYGWVSQVAETQIMRDITTVHSHIGIVFSDTENTQKIEYNFVELKYSYCLYKAYTQGVEDYKEYLFG